ncbi:MAG: nucleoside phosphorylase [Candidatus Promineifilaceae bacterium]|nr:nucleoside phosphorylase [Candidatus Promineifilaceae bacterium]
MTVEKLPITGLIIGSISSDVIVCGDPKRASRIADKLQDCSLLGANREYQVYLGQYGDKAITICSHGVGAPGAAIAFEELITAGARQIIRVGTCGGLQHHIRSGHLIVATAAVQNTGYVREIVPQGYPASADPKLSVDLQESAARCGHAFTNGIVLTRDAFYGGVPTPETPNYELMSRANVLAVEMECAALFVVGHLRGARTAAILTVDGNVLQGEESMETYKPDREVVTQAVGAAIDIALQAFLAS